ncbi:MAG: hypothetical protein WBW77_05375 [Candidatus Sulfotelmatobacter sp.]
MKSVYRLSGFVFLAGLMCFLPSTFGQSRANVKATSATHSVLNYEPSSLLAFAFTSGHDLYNNNGKGGNGGYGNGGYGNGGNGKGGDGNGGTCSYSPSKGGDKCAAVPEGGTPLMYLLLAGLSCLGAMVLRRQPSTPRSH